MSDSSRPTNDQPPLWATSEADLAVVDAACDCDSMSERHSAPRYFSPVSALHLVRPDFPRTSECSFGN